MNFRTYYSVIDGETRKGLACSDKSRTRQEFLKESLTSTIIDRFTRTGVLCPNANPQRQPLFGDFSELPSDLLDAHKRLESFRSGFYSLPSTLRAAFGNDPLAFVQFMSNPVNKSKAIALGIIDAPKAQPSKPKPLADSISDASRSGEASDSNQSAQPTT